MAVNGFVNHSINGPTGSIYGYVNGNINGDVLGDIFGQVNGNIKGDVKGSIYGFVNGNVQGLVYGKVTGQINGKYRSTSNNFNSQFNMMTQFNSSNLMLPKISISFNKINCLPIINYSRSINNQQILEKKFFQDLNGNIDSKSESLVDCPICLKNLNEIKFCSEQLLSSQCGHVMCYSCFEKVFENKNLINCPCCGLEQIKSKYHRIFI